MIGNGVSCFNSARYIATVYLDLPKCPFLVNFTVNIPLDELITTDCYMKLISSTQGIAEIIVCLHNIPA